MSSDQVVDASILKNTQESLGKVVKKVPLSDKLLSRPPFKFLHDIIKEIVSNTDFLRGLYSQDELNAINVKSKEAKIKFLQKLIDTLGFVTGQIQNVKAGKIVAGMDANSTNELLQTLANCVITRKESAQAVRKVLKGEKLSLGESSSAVSKSETKSASKPITKSVTKSTFKPEVNDSKWSTGTDKRKTSTVAKQPVSGLGSRTNGVSSKLNAARTSALKPATKSIPKSIDTRKNGKLTRPSSRTNSISDPSVPAIKPEAPTQKESDEKSIDSLLEPITIKGSTKTSNSPPLSDKSEDVDLTAVSNESQIKRPTTSTRSARKMVDPSSESTTMHEDNRLQRTTTSKEINQQNQTPSLNDSSKQVSSNATQSLSIDSSNRPITARPLTARPTTARAPPPPLSARLVAQTSLIDTVNSDSNVAVPLVSLIRDASSDDESVSTNEPLSKSGLISRMEKRLEEQENAVQKGEEVIESSSMGFDYSRKNDETKGSLVKKLVESKQQLEGTEVEDQQTSATDRMDAMQVRKAIDSVQSLCRLAAPSAKSVEYLQEEAEAMFAEQRAWRAEAQEAATQLREKRKVHEQELKGLREQLETVEEQIRQETQLRQEAKSALWRNHQQLVNIAGRLVDA